jgi:hypothetical protein
MARAAHRRRALGALALALQLACATTPAATSVPDQRKRAAPGAPSCVDEEPSPCVSRAPIMVTQGLAAWAEEIRDRGQRVFATKRGLVDCRWVAEIDDVLLCGAFDAQAVSAMLVRAAMFIEGSGGIAQGVVSPRSGDAYTRMSQLTAGFDLVKDDPDPKRYDLIGYYAAVDRACESEPKLCLDDAEKAMRQLLERAWSDRERFVVLSFAVFAPLPFGDIVSHEILHAQYFLDPAYRTAVEVYWAALDEAARGPIVAALASEYAESDDYLMRNEFQAYVLQAGADRGRLSRFLAAHRAPLMAQLKKHGVVPIQVERHRDH